MRILRKANVKFDAIEYFSVVMGCLVAGAGMAIMLTVIAAVVYSIGGSSVEREYGPLRGLFFPYAKGGLLGGAVIGVLSPLSRWYGGTLLLGWLGAGVLYYSVLERMWGTLGSWHLGQLGAGVFWSLICGTVGGNKAWKSMQIDSGGKLPHHGDT